MIYITTTLAIVLKININFKIIAESRLSLAEYIIDLIFFMFDIIKKQINS